MKEVKKYNRIGSDNMKSLSPFYNTFEVAIKNCWPMLALFIVIITVLRITKIIINHEEFIFHKEFFRLLAVLYFLLLYYMLQKELLVDLI